MAGKVIDFESMICACCLNRLLYPQNLRSSKRNREGVSQLVLHFDCLECGSHHIYITTDSGEFAAYHVQHPLHSLAGKDYTTDWFDLHGGEDG